MYRLKDKRCFPDTIPTTYAVIFSGESLSQELNIRSYANGRVFIGKIKKSLVGVVPHIRWLDKKNIL